MDKRNKMRIKLDNDIVAHITTEGEELCLRTPTQKGVSPFPWVVNIGDWDMGKLLKFLQKCGGMSSFAVDTAFRYDVKFNNGIEDALSKVEKNKVFDTGCTSYVQLANQLLAEEAFGSIMTIVDNSVDCTIMAELLQEEDCVYRDGMKLPGGYFQSDIDGHIVGYIDE